MFHHWLSSTRNSRRRRVTLRQKEDVMKRACIAVAWDKWRDRFTNEKLRPIVSAHDFSGNMLNKPYLQEHSATVQSQHNLLFRAFGMWHSKTNVCLPLL
jgi:protein SFI1